MRDRAVKAGVAARALSLLVLLILPCGGAVAAPEPLNVVIVLWDTARYDHTSPAGYFRDTTPNLAALAGRGVFFTNAFSQSNWTMPAVASLFTGLRAPSHGLVNAADRLPDQAPTLAEVFRKNGFRTASFTSGIIRGSSGFERGFETVISTNSRQDGLGSLKEPQEAALAWIREHAGSPFFVYIHGADAHYPYACPPERRFLFSDKEYKGISGDLKVDRGFIAAFDRDIEPEFLRSMTVPVWDRAQAVRSGRSDLAYLVSQYDGCLNYADSLLPQLTGTLAELDLVGRTALIVLSDHGEALGDHGGYGHFSRPLYDEISRIVLAASLPGAVPGRRVSEPVEMIDIMPTLLELENWPLPAGLEGRSLAGLLRGGAPPPERPLWSAASARPSAWPRRIGLQALRYGDWKVLRDHEGWKLYDLKSDPGEERDLFRSEPGTFVGLAARLLSLGQAAGGSAPPWEKSVLQDIEAAGIKELERQAAAGEPGRERRLLELAAAYERQGDFAAVERVCLAGLADSPREEGLADILARAYLKGGRLAELAALRRKQKGGEAHLPLRHVLDLAGALVHAGGYEDAEEVLRRADSGGRPPEEAAVLRDKLALAKKIQTAIGSPREKCAAKAYFERTGQGWTVSQPPWTLKYSAAGGGLSLERDGRPAAGPKAVPVAARLAGLLLDHVEELRFAAAPAAAELPDGLAEKLRAAGYIQ